MERLSASGVAGLFENFPNMPRKKTKPGEFLLNTVFPRGHVREHDCIHYLSRCQGIQKMRGQNGFARGVEYLEEDLLRIYSDGSWLVSENRKLFNKLAVSALASKILNEAASRIAFKEKSILLLLEEEVGERFLDSFSKLLKSQQDISSEEAFKTNVIQPAIKLAHNIFFSSVGSKEKGYMVKNIPYTLPRYRTDYGGVEIVCQPDGYCIANGKKSVVEIKSPMYGHYTSMATKANPEQKGKTTAKTAADRRKLWIKYLVQIAIEMDVTNAEQAIFLSWFDHTGKVIVLDRTIMNPLIEAVKDFVSDLSMKKQGTRAASLEDALHKVSGTEEKVKPNETIAQLKEKLTKLGFTDFTFGKQKDARTKKPYLEKLAELTKQNPSKKMNTNSFEKVKSILQNIVEQLSKHGDAWVPLGDVYPVSGLDVVAASLEHLTLDNSSKMYSYMEHLDESRPQYRIYVKN